MVRYLLVDDRDGRVLAEFASTLQAARVLAPEEPSLTTVTALLADDNPAIRTEAARAVEERFPEALTVIRQMLNEPDPWIRLYAAGALLHH